MKMKEASEGGRQGPTPPGYYRTVIVHHTGNFSCRVLAGEHIALTPGLDYDADVELLLENAIGGFKTGDAIEFWEGITFATGKVIEIE